MIWIMKLRICWPIFRLFLLASSDPPSRRKKASMRSFLILCHSRSPWTRTQQLQQVSSSSDGMEKEKIHILLLHISSLRHEYQCAECHAALKSAHAISGGKQTNWPMGELLLKAQTWDGLNEINYCGLSSSSHISSVHLCCHWRTHCGCWSHLLRCCWNHRPPSPHHRLPHCWSWTRRPFQLDDETNILFNKDFYTLDHSVNVFI